VALIVNALIDKRSIELTLIIENGIVTKSVLGDRKDICRENRCMDLRRYGIAVPGFIDIHTHLRGLELEYKEDEKSGTMAATRGGYTAVIDMPNTIPKINNIDALKLKLHKLNLNSYVHYGVYILPSSNISELNNMLEYDGVIGVKLFPEDLEFLQIALNVIRRRSFDRIIIIHAEHPAGIDECEAGNRWRCRPIELELMCLNYIEKHIRKGDRIHVTHITNPLTFFYAKKLSLSTDTCPHYLYLSNVSEQRYGCLAKVNPPLRTESTRRILLNMIKYFDAISTDHAPHSVNEKLGSFKQCPSGIASIDIASSLVINLVHQGVLDLDDVVRLLSLGPASIIGIDQKWGCFREGCIANYTIIEPYREFTVRSLDSFSKAKCSPYEGMRVRGTVTATIIEGTLVHLNGEIVEKPNPKPITKFFGR
ncbi:MAG: dihydroorotase, partial [Ignisphaera sp.]